MPHGKGVSPFRVGQVFDTVVFEIVNRDGLGQAAVVTLQVRNFERWVIGDFRAVRRKRTEPPSATGRGSGRPPSMLTLKGRLVHPFERRGEEKQNALTVREPGDNPLWMPMRSLSGTAAPDRTSAAWVGRPGRALRRHLKLPSYCPVKAIHLPSGENFGNSSARVGGDARASPPELDASQRSPAVHEDNLVLVDVGESASCGLRHFLR